MNLPSVPSWRYTNGGRDKSGGCFTARCFGAVLFEYSLQENNLIWRTVHANNATGSVYWKFSKGGGGKLDTEKSIYVVSPSAISRRASNFPFHCILLLICVVIKDVHGFVGLLEHVKVRGKRGAAIFGKYCGGTRLCLKQGCDTCDDVEPLVEEVKIEINVTKKAKLSSFRIYCFKKLWIIPGGGKTHCILKSLQT